MKIETVASGSRLTYKCKQCGINCTRVAARQAIKRLQERFKLDGGPICLSCDLQNIEDESCDSKLTSER